MPSFIRRIAAALLFSSLLAAYGEPEILAVLEVDGKPLPEGAIFTGKDSPLSSLKELAGKAETRRGNGRRLPNPGNHRPGVEGVGGQLLFKGKKQQWTFLIFRQKGDHMADTIKQLKTLQADALTLFVKMHNYHWNIKGMQFFPIHEMTERIYNGMAELYDDCAERVLQLGGKPYVTMEEIAKATRVKEESKTDFDAKTVLDQILAESEALLKAFRKLSEKAGEENDPATAAFADDKIASLEKDIWMLKASLA